MQTYDSSRRHEERFQSPEYFRQPQCLELSLHCQCQTIYGNGLKYLTKLAYFLAHKHKVVRPVLTIRFVFGPYECSYFVVRDLFVYDNPCSELIRQGWDPLEPRFSKSTVVTRGLWVTSAPSHTSYFCHPIHSSCKIDSDYLFYRPGRSGSVRAR